MQYAPVVAGVVLLVLFLAWQVPARSRVFVIRIRNGVPTQTGGKVAQVFMVEVADIVRQCGIRRGLVFGVNRGSTITLGFSRTIPANCRQTLRNVWAMHTR